MANLATQIATSINQNVNANTCDYSTTIIDFKFICNYVFVRMCIAVSGVLNVKHNLHISMEQ